jgi:KDO2-lipid IV(A) lauroyltransferase
MKRLYWVIQLFIVILITLPIALIPYRLSLKAGGLLGSLLFFGWRSRRKIAIDNLKGVISRGLLASDSSPESVIKENFRNLGKSFVEIIKIYYGLGGPIFRNVEIRGADNFRNALKKGSGVILLTGHCGNWELNALACSAKITPISVVARPVNNPFINRLVEMTRRKYGNKVIYKQGALKKILSALKRNEAVGILMDQSVLRSEGVVAEFLGKKDYPMKTPALIAMKSGCAVVPAFIRRVDSGHIIEAGEEIELDASGDGDKDVFTNTVRFSRCIEDFIRQHPTEWLWMHRRWKRIPEQPLPIP